MYVAVALLVDAGAFRSLDLRMTHYLQGRGSTGQDIGLNPDPNLDAAAYGRIAGQFAALSGVTQSAPNTSTYDVLFNTPLDRDAGWDNESLREEARTR